MTVASKRIWTLLLAAVTLASAVLGQQRYPGYDFGPAVHKLRAKRNHQANGPLVLSKLANADGDLPLRHEIRDLENNRDQWTLYLLGLSMMQFTNQSDPLSWYQITGIHGVPFKTWGGVNATPGNEMNGYCTHISILFPTWHRPYVSIYENILYSMMQDIAGLWPNQDDRTRYQSAATNFRIPYWDWALTPPAGESVLPKSIGGSEFIDIDGPNGEQRIANPLFNYQFRPLDSADFLNVAPWDIWTQTVRAPTSNNTTAGSNNSWVEKTLAQNLPSLQQRLYNLFSNYGNYTEFSNEAWIPDLNNASYDSLESVHDAVHNIAGGLSGHMAYIPFSAFDPIFFLHHANVDRLFAMWQALYPSSWVEPAEAITATYTTSVGQTLDSKTALTPFYAKTDGTFWNSDMVRDPKVLGYSYQEVAGSSLTSSGSGGKGSGGKGSSGKDPHSQSQSRLQSRVRTAINRLYGGPSPASLTLKWKSGVAPHMRIPASLIADGRYREWIANVRVDKRGLGGPFMIHLFLDLVPEDSETWAFADTLVGTMSVFAAPAGMPGMPTGTLHVAGTVPLTAALKDKVLNWQLDSLQPEHVETYLRANLLIGVRTAGGTVVDVSDVPGLHIHVASSAVRAPEGDDELPVWKDEVESHFDLV